MDTYTSHQRVFATLIICLGIVGSVATWQYMHQDRTFSKSDQAFVSENNTLATTSPLDNMNWQKTLLETKTSLYDGDVGDAQTISNGQQTSTSTPTLTDQLAQDYFSRVLMAQQSLNENGGGEIGSEDATQMVQEILTNPAYTNAQGTQYTVSSIHDAGNSSEETVLAYYNAMKMSFTNHSPKNNVNELTIVQDAVSTKNPKELDKLKPIIDGYKGIIQDMLKMNVPSDAVAIHLALLNSASNVESNIEAMQHIFDDPVRSYSGYSQYMIHGQQLETAYNNLKKYFAGK